MKPGAHGIDWMADILFEAKYAKDDLAVAKRNDISVRSLWRYRARMKTDPALAELVREKSKAIDGMLRDKLQVLASVAIDKATMLAANVKPGQTEHLHALVGAFKIALEQLLEADVLHGLTGKNRPNPKTPPAAGTVGDGTGTGRTPPIN